MTKGEKCLIDLGYKKINWGKGYEVWENKHYECIEFHFDDISISKKTIVSAWNDCYGEPTFSIEDLEAIIKRMKELNSEVKDEHSNSNR